MRKADFWPFLGFRSQDFFDSFGVFELKVYPDCVEIYFDRLEVIKDIPDFEQDGFRIFSNGDRVLTLVLTYELD